MIKQLKQPGLEGKKSWEGGRHTELLGILHHFPSRYLLIQKEHNAQACLLYTSDAADDRYKV